MVVMAPVGINRDHARRDALENGFDIAPPPFDFDVLPLERNRAALDAASARGQFAGHRIERFHQRPELVAALGLDALVEPARADFARGRRERLHRPRNPLREVEAHPRGADQNQQRGHEEERQVHTGQGPLEHAQLVVVFVRLRHPPRADDQIARQIVGRDHHADRRPARPRH